MIELKVVSPGAYKNTLVTLQLHKDGSVTWTELSQDNWTSFSKESPLTPENMDPEIWYDL